MNGYLRTTRHTHTHTHSSGSGDRKGDQFYFEDQGMVGCLASEQVISKEQRFAFSQLYASAHYSQTNDFTLNYFETKAAPTYRSSLNLGATALDLL